MIFKVLVLFLFSAPLVSGILVPDYCNSQGCFYSVNGTFHENDQQITLQMDTGNFTFPFIFAAPIVNPNDLTWFNVTMRELNFCLDDVCDNCTVTPIVEERAQLNYTISLPGQIAGQSIVLHNSARTAVSVYGNLFYFSKEDTLLTQGLFSNTTGQLMLCPPITSCLLESPDFSCSNDSLCHRLYTRSPISGACVGCLNGTSSVTENELVGSFSIQADFYVSWSSSSSRAELFCVATSGLLHLQYEIADPGVLPPVVVSPAASYVLSPIIYIGGVPQHFNIVGNGTCRFVQYPLSRQPDGCVIPSSTNFTIDLLRFEGLVKLDHTRNCLTYSYVFSQDDDATNDYTITINYQTTCVSSSVSVVSSSKVCVCERSPCSCVIENTYAKLIVCENGLCQTHVVTYYTDPDCSPWCNTSLSDLPWFLRWLLLFLFIGVGLSVLVFAFGTLGLLKIFSFPFYVLYKILRHPIDYLIHRQNVSRVSDSEARLTKTAVILCILMLPLANSQTFPIASSNVTFCDTNGCHAKIVNTFDFQGALGDSQSLIYTYKDVIQNVTLTLVDMYYAYPLARLYKTRPVNLTYSCHCDCPDGTNHYCQDQSVDVNSTFYAARASTGTASGCTWSSFGSGHWCCGVSYSFTGQSYEVLKIENAESLFFKFQVDVGKGKCEFEWAGVASFYTCLGIKFTLVGALNGPLKYNGGGYISGSRYLDVVNNPGQFDMTLNGWYQEGEPLSRTALLSAFTSVFSNCYDNVATITTNYWDISVQGNPLTALSAFGVPEIAFGVLRLHPILSPALQISVIGNLTLPISLDFACPVIDHIATNVKDGGYPDFLYVVMHSTCGSGTTSMSYSGFTPLQGCTPRFVGSEDITCAIAISVDNKTIQGAICAEGMTKYCKSFNITLVDNQWTVGTSQHEFTEVTNGPGSGFSGLDGPWQLPLIGGASLLIVLVIFGVLSCVAIKLVRRFRR